MRDFNDSRFEFASSASASMREVIIDQHDECLVADPRSRVRPVESVEQKLQHVLQGDRSRSGTVESVQ